MRALAEELVIEGAIVAEQATGKAAAEILADAVGMFALTGDVNNIYPPAHRP